MRTASIFVVVILLALPVWSSAQKQGQILAPVGTAELRLEVWLDSVLVSWNTSRMPWGIDLTIIDLTKIPSYPDEDVIEVRKDSRSGHEVFHGLEAGREYGIWSVTIGPPPQYLRGESWGTTFATYSSEIAVTRMQVRDDSVIVWVENKGNRASHNTYVKLLIDDVLLGERITKNNGTIWKGGSDKVAFFWQSAPGCYIKALVSNSSKTDQLWNNSLVIQTPRMQVDPWVIQFLLTSPYGSADSISIHHYSGEPYPIEWLSNTTRQTQLVGDSSFIIFERDFDHDITRMLHYVGFELNFRVTCFREGQIVYGQEIGVIAEVEGIKYLSATSVPSYATNSWKFSLQQNYPNPFNPTTTIEYELPRINEVNLTVYNMIGQVQETLFNGWQDAGTHRIIWDASLHPAGIYFLKLDAGSFSRMIKMTVLK